MNFDYYIESVSHLLGINNDTIMFDNLFEKITKKEKKVYESLPLYRKILFLLNVDVFCKEIIDIFESHFACQMNTKILKELKNVLSIVFANGYCKNTLDDFMKAGKYTNIYNMIITQKQNLQNILHIDNFVVFGCPESCDIDVAIIVTNENDLSKIVDITSLENQLYELGYDITQKIDINVVHIKNSNFVNATKGCKETQNIIYMTYDYHRQKYPNPFNKCVENDSIEYSGKKKIMTIAKFILDYLESLLSVEKYSIERNNKKQVYKNQESRLKYARHIVSEIEVLDTCNFKDAFKSLTMKIIQLHLLQTNRYEYTKRKMAQIYANDHKLDVNTILWFLFRGNEGYYSYESMNNILNTFIEISDIFDENILQWNSINLNITNTFKFENEIVFNEFVKSPLIATDLFCEEFESICPDHQIGKLFLIQNQNVNLLPNEFIENHVIDVIQRSDEWRDLREKSNKTTNIREYDTTQKWSSFYYNLIRGCLIEEIVINNFDFSQIFTYDDIIDKITIGVITSEKSNENSVCVSPDLLLFVNKKEIIPVEIKCNIGKRINNHSYRRSISLATKQIKSTIDIIKLDQTIECSRGLIIFVNIYEENNKYIFSTEYTFFY